MRHDLTKTTYTHTHTHTHTYTRTPPTGGSSSRNFPSTRSPDIRCEGAPRQGRHQHTGSAPMSSSLHFSEQTADGAGADATSQLSEAGAWDAPQPKPRPKHMQHAGPRFGRLLYPSPAWGLARGSSPRLVAGFPTHSGHGSRNRARPRSQLRTTRSIKQ